MAVTLRKATHDDRELLRRLLADYLFEFDGRADPYTYLDAYWRAAVEAVATLARAAGAAHLQAKVHPDNRQALPFWLAVGFREYDLPGVVVTRREL